MRVRPPGMKGRDLHNGNPALFASVGPVSVDGARSSGAEVSCFSTEHEREHGPRDGEAKCGEGRRFKAQSLASERGRGGKRDDGRDRGLVKGTARHEGGKDGWHDGGHVDGVCHEKERKNAAALARKQEGGYRNPEI